MPRVSDAYRQARRDEIVAATLRVLSRRGLRALTMADIVEESGLSAGSVYSHFTNKHELLELVATRVIGERAEALTEHDEGPLAPLEIVTWWLSGLEQDGLPFGVVLQIWGEASSDPDIRAVVQHQVAAIESAFAGATSRWLVATGGDPAAAPDLARTMLTLCQGYIVRTAVLGPQDLTSSFTAVDLLR